MTIGLSLERVAGVRAAAAVQAVRTLRVHLDPSRLIPQHCPRAGRSEGNVTKPFLAAAGDGLGEALALSRRGDGEGVEGEGLLGARNGEGEGLPLDGPAVVGPLPVSDPRDTSWPNREAYGGGEGETGAVRLCCSTGGPM